MVPRAAHPIDFRGGGREQRWIVGIIVVRRHRGSSVLQINEWDATPSCSDFAPDTAADWEGCRAQLVFGVIPYLWMDRLGQQPLNRHLQLRSRCSAGFRCCLGPWVWTAERRARFPGARIDRVDQKGGEPAAQNLCTGARPINFRNRGRPFAALVAVHPHQMFASPVDYKSIRVHRLHSLAGIKLELRDAHEQPSLTIFVNIEPAASRIFNLDTPRIFHKPVPLADDSAPAL